MGCAADESSPESMFYCVLRIQRPTSDHECYTDALGTESTELATSSSKMFFSLERRWQEHQCFNGSHTVVATNTRPEWKLRAGSTLFCFPEVSGKEAKFLQLRQKNHCNEACLAMG